MNTRILSTKKLPDSLIRRARQGGLSVEQIPLIRIQPVFTPEKVEEIASCLRSNPDAAVLFTSAHAVSAVCYLLKNSHLEQSAARWAVYCLSGKTKKTVRDAFPGARLAGVADQAEALSALVIKNQIREAVFFCGNIRRSELPDRLRKAGVSLAEITVYQTEKTPEVIAGPFDGILFFSPSAVQSYFAVNKPDPGTVFFAIGPTTAAEIAGFTDGDVLMSQTPSPAELMELVCRHFSTSQPIKHGPTAEK